MKDESNQIDIKIGGDANSDTSLPRSYASNGHGSPFKSPLKQKVQKFGAGVKAVEDCILNSPNSGDPVIKKMNEKLLEGIRPKKKDDGSPKMALLRQSPSDTGAL